MGILLFLLSVIISIILFPIGLIVGIIKAIYNNKFFSEGIFNINQKFRTLAVSIDMYGNVMASELFNYCLIKDDIIHPFGQYGETISQVIGYNKLNHNLTYLGIKLDNLLDYFDKNHSLKSINHVY